MLLPIAYPVPGLRDAVTLLTANPLFSALSAVALARMFLPLFRRHFGSPCREAPILETGNAGSACAPCASRHGTGAEPEAGADSGLQQAAWRRPQRLRAVLPR